MQLRSLTSIAIATIALATAAQAQDARPLDSDPAPANDVVISPAPDTAETLSLEEFLAIYGTEDLNADGQVDEADYQLWLANPFFGVPIPDAAVEPAPLEAWLVSIWATDLDGDGAADEADYHEYLDRAAPEAAIGEAAGDADAASPMTEAEWLDLYAVDLNQDGQVDGGDYQLWVENPFIGIPTAVASTSWGAVKQGASR